ncbi:hypothetical protein F4801DRAFT_553360 [Xylaria longipes]|nr:hypothetical protein F4801DRAFT_553360 [Xylaria longipes]RYC63556.1 hypothetical protein CHU98_g2615 [Xylaria longipes]
MAAERLLNRTRAQQLDFVRNIWPSISEDAFQHEDYTRLFRFIDRMVNSTTEYPARYSKHSVDEIAEYIRFLRENFMHSKAQVIVKNQPSQGTEGQVLSRTLDLAASVWLTTRVDTEVASGCVTWKPNETLQDCIQSHFRSVTVVDDTKRDITPRSLTVAYLCKKHGFTVYWTDDLRHHLNVDWENQRITVYEHLIYLCNYLNYPASTPISIDIIEEAVDTINLLFPSDQKRTKIFLKGENKTFNRLGYCGRERRMRLSDYHHWHERISALKEALDDAPKGHHQLVLDKEHQNFLSWATFWIAFIVALLTIISIAFGIVGIVFAVFSYAISVKSYKIAVDSLDVSIQQLEIAIAMACVDAEVAARLPQYCSGT